MLCIFRWLPVWDQPAANDVLVIILPVLTYTRLAITLQVNNYFFPFPGKFIATCLPSVPTRGLTADDVTDLTDNVRKQMLDTFNQSSFEATQNKLASKITNGAK